MSYIEQKNLGAGYSSQDPLSSVISQGTSSLTFQEFAGLFLLTGSSILLALFCSTTSIGRKLTLTTQHFVRSCFSPRTTTPVHSTMELSSLDVDNGGATPPPPGESGGASTAGDEAAEVSETAPENEPHTDAGGGTENEEPPLAPHLNQG